MSALFAEFGLGDASYIPGILSKYQPVEVATLAERMVFTCDFKQWYRTAPPGSLCVFTDDRTAAEAVEFFRRAGIAVPRDRAILGLQNDPVFFHCGISSCIPDWRTIGYLMAHALLKDIPIERSRRGYLRASTRFLSRLTTR